MEKSGNKGPFQGQQAYNVITALIISEVLHPFPCILSLLASSCRCHQNKIMRTASNPPASAGRAPSTKPQLLWSVPDLHYWTASRSLPAKAPPCCSVKLLHPHRASPYLHNKWDIPKHNIFMIHLKPPAHYHSSNLSSRKWIPHLHRAEIWKLIVKLQMDHWEPKRVEDCSAKIKPLISGGKRFIVLGSLSQV